MYRVFMADFPLYDVPFSDILYSLEEAEKKRKSLQKKGAPYQNFYIKSVDNTGNIIKG